jgi:uncharacterized Zn-binding protein involved in type VI secretion
MAAATLTGVDTAGGGLITAQPGAPEFVAVKGQTWATLGALVAFHGIGLHEAAVIATGSAFVRIAGVPVVRAGDLATCGHAATGSGHVDVDA